MWLLASLLCLTPLQAHVDCMYVVGIVGENFTFPVQIDQKVVEPVWMKNKDIVAEWEEQNKPTYFDPLRNRSVLMENGSLTIFNLEKDDAGTYMLQYWDSVKDHYLDFELDVLDSLPEPNISCSTSDDELVLNCTARFQGDLSYTWKLSNKPHSYQIQELSIPLKHVGTTTKATCIIKFLQTGRSSEISLIQCLPEEKGDRSRGSLIGVFVLTTIILVGILVFLCRKAVFSHAVRDENEEPKEDTALNEDDGALKDKQIVKNDVNQEAAGCHSGRNCSQFFPELPSRQLVKRSRMLLPESPSSTGMHRSRLLAAQHPQKLSAAP